MIVAFPLEQTPLPSAFDLSPQVPHEYWFLATRRLLLLPSLELIDKKPFTYLDGTS